MDRIVYFVCCPLHRFPLHECHLGGPADLCCDVDIDEKLRAPRSMASRLDSSQTLRVLEILRVSAAWLPLRRCSPHSPHLGGPADAYNHIHIDEEFSVPQQVAKMYG